MASAAFGIGATSISLAEIQCDDYTAAKAKFKASKPHAPERSMLALEIQQARQALEETVRGNRRRLRVLPGGKP